VDKQEEKKMARWLVQLSGERADLEEFPRWFPDGEVFAIEENEAFFLVGPAFEVHTNAEAVLGEAVRAINRLTAIISLIGENSRTPTPSSVIREADGGRRDAHVFLSAGLSMRSKLHAVLGTGDVTQQKSQRTQAQELLSRVIGRPHLEQVLTLWADQLWSWPRLYRIIEEIEQHLGKNVDVAKLCSPDERTRFRRTANTAEVSGPDARHASGKFVAPDNPMSVSEATEFVRQIILSVLR
jgi:hypothetical protein